MKIFILNYTIQYFLYLIIIIGIIFIMRYLGTLLQQKIIIGNGLSKASYLLLAPGVIIHELSHLIFVIIFGHKIDKVSLFNPNLENGTLGYVNHEYNQSNLYQRIGNPFIGIAPLIGISTTIILSYRILFKNNFYILYSEISANQFDGLKSFFYSIKLILFQLLQNFTTINGLIKMILFLIILVILSSGMSLSNADLQNASAGLINLLLIIFFIGGIIKLFLPNLFLSFLSSLSLLIIISLIMILIQLLIITAMNKLTK